MDKLLSVFHPFVSRSQIDALKIAALYFDKVYVLTPLSFLNNEELFRHYGNTANDRLIRRFGESLGFEPAGKRLATHESVLANIAFQQHAKPLIEAEVIKVVNPFDELNSIGLKHEFGAIIEYRARQSQQYEYVPIDDFRMCSPIPVHIDFAGTDHLSPEESLLQAKANAIKSILFDSAVLVSRRYDAIPITSNLLTDLEFSLQATTGDYLHSGDPVHVLMRAIKERKQDEYEIARQTILENVPDFAEVDFGDILALRKHCEYELDAFRVEVRKLAALLRRGPLDVEKRMEISDIVSKEVTPVINELNRKIRVTRGRWVEKAIGSASIEAVASIVSTIFLGIPLHYGLLIAASLAGVQTALRTYFETKELKATNGLSFVIELQKKSR